MKQSMIRGTSVQYPEKGSNQISGNKCSEPSIRGEINEPEMSVQYPEEGKQ